jgi:predicted nucleic acid-binding protein
MIVPDVNLLLYSVFETFPQHAKAKKWWKAALANDVIGFALPVVFGFVRLATSRKVFDPPLTVAQASLVVSGWLECEQVEILVPGPRIENQATLYSHDADFSRFAGLRWGNPLKV